jgi:hypothetical protein
MVVVVAVVVVVVVVVVALVVVAVVVVVVTVVVVVAVAVVVAALVVWPTPKTCGRDQCGARSSRGREANGVGRHDAVSSRTHLSSHSDDGSPQARLQAVSARPPFTAVEQCVVAVGSWIARATLAKLSELHPLSLL